MRISEIKKEKLYAVQDDRLGDEAIYRGDNLIAELTELYANDWAESDMVVACGGDPLRDETDYQITELTADTWEIVHSYGGDASRQRAYKFVAANPERDLFAIAIEKLPAELVREYGYVDDLYFRDREGIVHDWVVIERKTGDIMQRYINLAYLKKGDVLDDHLAGWWVQTGVVAGEGGRERVTDSRQPITQRMLDADGWCGPFQTREAAEAGAAE